MKKMRIVTSAVLVASLMASMTVGFADTTLSTKALFSQTLEAENAVLAENTNPTKPFVTSLNSSNSVKLGSMEYTITSGFSGSGGVALTNGPAQTLDLVTFTVNVPSAGKYNLTFTSTDVYKSESRKNALFIENDFWGYFYSGEDTWSDYTIPSVYLHAGTNNFTIRKSSTCDGNIYLDKVTVQQISTQVCDFYDVEPVLSNPNSNQTTKRLFSYLCDIYGKQTLTGQFSDSSTAKEIKAIQGVTGKTPAMIGFDLMNYTSCYAHYLPDNAQKLKTTNNIINWVNNEGGIATLTWHWYAPVQFIENDAWTASFRTSALYTKPTADHPVYFDLKNIMSGKDESGYNSLITDIDMIAEQLKILQNNGISVLWRPLHEAAGNETSASWFWWGQDRESYIQLWKLVYDRLTDYHGLNNLIWVWNGQDPSWYPGDNYVDVIGWDVYPKAFDYKSSSNRFWQSTSYPQSHNKLIALSENGTMPSIDNMKANNTMWSYFCTWSGEYVINTTSAFAENYTSKAELTKLYTSSDTITLDELPGNLYESYPIGATTYSLEKAASEKYVSPYGVTPGTDTETDSETPPVTGKAGDINKDGNVDIIDIVLLRGFIVSNNAFTAEQKKLADVNNDGNSDIIDVVLIRATIVNN